MSDERDLIDGYLDRLLSTLRVDPRRTRRILVECEDHLREAASRSMEQGSDPSEAQQTAIAEFGTPMIVARRFAADEGRLLPPSLLLDLLLALALLCGIGMAAIGVSGAVAAGMGAGLSERFVSGDVAGLTYTAERCEYFMAYERAARDCAAAATAHHFGEVVSYRIAAGLLGVIIIAAWWVLQRRYPRRSGVRLLPEGFVPTTGASLFGLAALLLLGQSLMSIAFGQSDGSGAYLSGGIVSACMFAFFAVPLTRLLIARGRLAASIAGNE